MQENEGELYWRYLLQLQRWLKDSFMQGYTCWTAIDIREEKHRRQLECEETQTRIQQP